MRPKKPKLKKPKPRKAKRKPKSRAKRLIGASTRQTLIDRLEAAIQAEVIDLVEGEEEVMQLAISTSELALILLILLPEEYTAPTKKPRSTRTAPGSMARIKEYARRRDRKQEIFSKLDAIADGPGRGLKITQRRNGSGVKVVGWEDEDE